MYTCKSMYKQENFPNKFSALVSYCTKGFDLKVVIGKYSMEPWFESSYESILP